MRSKQSVGIIKSWDEKPYHVALRSRL